MQSGYIGETSSLPVPTFSQAAVNAPTPDHDGMYQVAASELKKLDFSPPVELPRQLAAWEFTDSVTVALTISPEGRVKKAHAITGKTDELKEATENTVKKWKFQPFLINGAPVPVRSEITFNFDNTLDHYRNPNGDVPVHLDKAAAHGLVAKWVPPEYPAEARLARIQGEVELRAIIGADGHLQALHIVAGHPLLAPAAYNAVRRWELKPYLENGKKVPVDTNVTVTFTIP